GGIFVSYYARSKRYWKTKRPMNQALRSQQGQGSAGLGYRTDARQPVTRIPQGKRESRSPHQQRATPKIKAPGRPGALIIQDLLWINIWQPPGPSRTCSSAGR